MENEETIIENQMEGDSTTVETNANDMASLVTEPQPEAKPKKAKKRKGLGKGGVAAISGTSGLAAGVALGLTGVLKPIELFPQAPEDGAETEGDEEAENPTDENGEALKDDADNATKDLNEKVNDLADDFSNIGIMSDGTEKEVDATDGEGEVSGSDDMAINLADETPDDKIELTDDGDVLTGDKVELTDDGDVLTDDKIELTDDGDVLTGDKIELTDDGDILPDDKIELPDDHGSLLDDGESLPDGMDELSLREEELRARELELSRREEELLARRENLMDREEELMNKMEDFMDKKEEELKIAPEPKDDLMGHDMDVAFGVDDSMSFNEAFAAARREVGPGGLFVWHGNTYGTYYANEWNAMSPADHDQYWADVYHTTHSIENGEYDPEPDPVEPDPNVGSDNLYATIDVDGDGNEDLAIVDVNGDGNPDVIIDTDGDGQLDTILIEGNGDNVVLNGDGQEGIDGLHIVSDHDVVELPTDDGNEMYMPFEDEEPNLFDDEFEVSDSEFETDNPDIDDLASLDLDTDIMIDNDMDMSDFA